MSLVFTKGSKACQSYMGPKSVRKERSQTSVRVSLRLPRCVAALQSIIFQKWTNAVNKGFFYGYYDGITGLYKEPIQGAKKDVRRS